MFLIPHAEREEYLMPPTIQHALPDIMPGGRDGRSRGR